MKEETKATIRNTKEEIERKAKDIWGKHKDLIITSGVCAGIFGVGYHLGKKKGSPKVHVYYVEEEEK